MHNVKLKTVKLSTWRKIALGTWRTVGDPSVYGLLEINATKLVERQRLWKERTGEKAPTVTVIVARAVALTLKHYPQINGLIRWGKIYRREEVSIFLQASVDADGEELSGVTIHHADAKGLREIAADLGTKVKAIREDKDPDFKKAKSNFKFMPAFFTKYMLSFLSFVIYTLNLDLRFIGIPKDPFGSVMVTSIGSLQMQHAFVPLVPWSRVPLLMAVGAIVDSPAVIDGKLAIAPMLNLCATFDHRFIDGVYGAKIAKMLRWLLETDDGLNEVMK